MLFRTILEDVTLSVSEIFGPTIQGEGRSQGQPVVFLRLSLCNLDCQWCDTPFTWDWTGKNGTKYNKADEIVRLNVSQIVARLEGLTDYDCRLVISGGEPFVQQRRLADVVDQWMPRPVEIETNGTIAPSDRFDGVQLNCSPKLANSGIDYDRRIVPEALQRIAAMDSTFKFVVNDRADITEIEQLRNTVLTDVEPHRIYLMPEGIAPETILARLPWVMNEASRHGYGVSPRHHVLAFGDRRGV